MVEQVKGMRSTLTLMSTSTMEVLIHYIVHLKLTSHYVNYTGILKYNDKLNFKIEIKINKKASVQQMRQSAK